MRASYVLACGWGAIVAAGAVACAASASTEEAQLRPDSGGGETVTPDGSVADLDVDADAKADDAGPLCSKAGWCATSLPDAELSMKDIWPLPGRAFAIAHSPVLGVKVLEWTDAQGTWAYIDDGTQNEPGIGKYAGNVWAPNENEAYYAVSPGYIYHGTRSAPGAPWSWTRDRLQDNNKPGRVDAFLGYPKDWMIPCDPDPVEGYSRDWLAPCSPALGVRGTSSGDVYAWLTNTIYHRKSVDGGAPGWIPEYIANDSEDPDEHLIFVAAGGESPDDLWFSGARARYGAACALAVRKTPAGYQRVADGVLVDIFFPCMEREGTPMIGGEEGWLLDIQTLAPNDVVGLKARREVVRISADDAGYSVDLATVPYEVDPYGSTSLWSEPGNLWLSTEGKGRVLRGSNVWDGGSYEISTTSLLGPLQQPVHRVRGTSNTNLWTIGDGYALHKTTP